MEFLEANMWSVAVVSLVLNTLLTALTGAVSRYRLSKSKNGEDNGWGVSVLVFGFQSHMLYFQAVGIGYIWLLSQLFQS